MSDTNTSANRNRLHEQRQANARRKRLRALTAEIDRRRVRRGVAHPLGQTLSLARI